MGVPWGGTSRAKNASRIRARVSGKTLEFFVIRPVPVAVTAGRGFMDRRGQLFLGFFGVRGVAALFYATVVVEADVLTPHDEHVLVWTTIVCVTCSILVHGFTAAPLTRRWLERGL